MTASAENPIYTTYIMAGTEKYNVTPATVELDFSEREKQIAQSVTIRLANIKVGDKLLSQLVAVCDRVYIYANDGTTKAEVFRGFIWEHKPERTMDGRELTLVAYDNLIYLQESEDSLYYSSGKSTSAVLASICKKWGVTLSYGYKSITHEKLVLRGSLSDIIINDILELVRQRTDTKYVVQSIKDKIHIKTVGTNGTIYTIGDKKNISVISSETSMFGVVTKVVITGKAGDDGRQPVEATLTKNTDKYGTLQKMLSRSENTELADVKDEANTILKEDGAPKTYHAVRAPDIPWVRKGDKIKIKTDGLSGNFIILSVDRNISAKNKTMTLELESA